MAQCLCGTTHAHLPHDCWAPKPKVGDRADAALPRCSGCNTLFAHLEHVCPQREAQEARRKANLKAP